MKVHTTNYFNTFILVAEDCPVLEGVIPPQKGDVLTIANLQYERISKNPYKYTSDELLFDIYCIKKDLTDGERESARIEFFSKGQACLRASPLAKRYGWGIHFNENGKIALYGRETEKYAKFSKDNKLATVKAMRSKMQ